MLLLHGFLGSTDNWNSTLVALAEAGYHTIAFDRPPFGLSDKNPDLDYTLAGQAALAVGLMDALDIETAVLVGHSAGGAVSAQVALDYPERVNKLVLVDAAIGMTKADSQSVGDNAVWRSFNFLASADPQSPLLRTAIRAFFNRAAARNVIEQSVENREIMTPEMLDRSLAYLQLPDWEVGLIAFSQAADWTKPDLDQLKQVDIPVLIVWGEKDRVVPIAIGERLRDTFPNATWMTYPATGHIPMLEVRQQFEQDVLAFLAE